MVSYDHKPAKTEPVGDGRYRYRWNIEQESSELNYAMMDEQHPDEKPVQWRGNEVIVPVLTSNVITKAVISSVWDSSLEQKLINDYNAAKLGLYGAIESDEAKAKIKAYTDFLNERNALKAQIDADCDELGIR